MQPENPHDDVLLVSNRTVEIIVALFLIGLSAVVIWDTARIGFGWSEQEGPQPGFFPFIVAMMMGVASLITLVKSMFFPSDEDRQDFVSIRGAGRILLVLGPLALYILGIQFLGIYVASAIFIAGFMVAFGKEAIWKAALVGIGVPVTLFFMFERWFLVALPKGPLEAMLGL
ncbi:MAG: tripartite tricarboxylate transporter TctB family protein [Hyphomicrobiaceae bacterium]|nr:tripartite tricarboxylate transporter TctB family protein [Hyphomicrobiaceae bacterium]